MKGCARTCLLQLLGWAAASGAFFYYLRGFGDFRPQLYWAAVGAGLTVMLALAYAIGILQAARERSTLLGAASGEPPADGAWVAVSGPIHSSQALRAPLSGQEVVAYEYSISRTEGSGKSSMQVTYYDGKGLVPSTISTRHGSVRLLSVPTFTDLPPADVMTMQAIENAEQYVAATVFQTRSTPKDQRIGMEHESTDDDGNFRVDNRKSDSEVDVRQCNLLEKHIRQNETVCVFGLYSQQRGGIIPHPNWAKQTRVMRGDAQTVANQLRNRMIKYLIGVVCFGAASYGVVRLYLHHVAQQ